MSEIVESPTFQNHEFRLHVRPHGDGFVVHASSLAESLGFREGSELVRTLPDENKLMIDVDTPGGRQRVWFVTEPGFYRALGQRQAARVRDDGARERVERFQDWVYGEVLPAIRKNGRYEHPDAVSEAPPELPATPADRIDALGAAVRSGFVPRKQGQRQADEILADLGLAERPRTLEEERLDVALRWIRRDHETGDTFSAREFHRALNGQYWVRTIRDTDTVLDDLVGTGHLRRLPRPTTMLRGRPPSPRFEVLGTRREIGGTP